MGSQGKYCQERKSLKKPGKSLIKTLRGEVLAQIGFLEKQKSASEPAAQTLLGDVNSTVI